MPRHLRGVSTSSGSTIETIASIAWMRFETVLFDLDGTGIDSGAMILASFRHATSSVLWGQLPKDQLTAALAGA